jgi:uncharacterized protein YceK
MKNILLTIAAVAISGCSSAPPTIQTGPDAEVTFDGLHVIDNSAFREAWADPDIDFSRYTKIMPGGAFFEYRAVKKTASNSRASMSDTEFWISDKDRARLEEEVSKVFDEELAKSTRFTITDTPGPDTLTIVGGLHDVMSRVPPERVGRSDVYLSDIGEATLILQVSDSMSGEVIARAVERRAAGNRSGGMAMRSSPAQTWAEVRRLARSWATKLVDGLDRLPAE